MEGKRVLVLFSPVWTGRGLEREGKIGGIFFFFEGEKLVLNFKIEEFLFCLFILLQISNEAGKQWSNYIWIRNNYNEKCILKKRKIQRSLHKPYVFFIKTFIIRNSSWFLNGRYSNKWIDYSFSCPFHFWGLIH